MASKSRYASAAAFYSYPATLIAEVLRVTVQTAYHYKSGIRRPGRTANRLWELYIHGRILDDAWAGWVARNGSIFDPEGHCISQPQLRAYAYVYALAYDLARGIPTAMEVLDRYASMGAERLRRDSARSRRKPRTGGSGTPASAAEDAATSVARAESECSERDDTAQRPEVEATVVRAGHDVSAALPRSTNNHAEGCPGEDVNEGAELNVSRAAAAN